MPNILFPINNIAPAAKASSNRFFLKVFIVEFFLKHFFANISHFICLVYPFTGAVQQTAGSSFNYVPLLPNFLSFFRKRAGVGNAVLMFAVSRPFFFLGFIIRLFSGFIHSQSISNPNATVLQRVSVYFGISQVKVRE
ncbi:MAG TPA: hypothetical protein DCM62_09595 [Bacteroidales bacterium]|nr:hypothetical protein [Bacteroidales bacterium]